MPEESTGLQPRVVVLMATYNGMPYLPEQMASILDQSGVRVRVVVLDDESSDGTVAWVDELAARDGRVTRLPSEGSSGSSAANFYRIMRRASVAGDEHVAFADQDDIWHPGKLARHAALMTSGGYDGISSNVTSFTTDGKRTLIRKNDPQRRFDFLLQSPGPGSTFLLSPRLFALARDVVTDHPDDVAAVDFHDSLVYVVARGRGWPWHIDAEPSVDYRQHGDNVIGANVGARSALSRLTLIRERWHRGQAIAMAKVAISVAEPDRRPELEQVLALFEAHGPRARWRLLRLAGQFRRRPRDRAIIGLLIGLGIW